MQDSDVEVSIKDIVEFYIKIDDSARAKSDIAKLSASDKARAFTQIAHSNASREFKVEIARYFVNDLDAHIRRKAELLLEDLVPGWVADPSSSILQVLRSAESKGPARRNAAVRFLFGIVDADSLRITITSLLSSKNRSHLVEIIEIIEQYIAESEDEKEQVKIFNACLSIVLSDEIEMSVKHHASNLLSAFFKKVASTSLGALLKAKYIERQTEKAESVFSFLCSGSCLLTAEYLEDLLRPLQEGCKTYQLKILSYFAFLLEKLRNEEEADKYIDIMPALWQQEMIGTAQKVLYFRKKILRQVEELWEIMDDDEVRDAVIAVVYSAQQDKSELLATIADRLLTGSPGVAAVEKMCRMLRCFLKSEENDLLKARAVRLLLLHCAEERCHDAALRYLLQSLEARLDPDAQQQLTADLMTFITSSGNEEEQSLAWTLIFLLDPQRLKGEAVCKQVLKRLRYMLEQEVLSNGVRERMTAALKNLKKQFPAEEKLQKAVAYLLFKLENPGEKPTWEHLK